MKIIFRFQDECEIANDGFLALEKNVVDAQITTHREMSKKDGKLLFLIHQCVDLNFIEKIIEREIIKDAWDTLKKLYG